MNALSNQMKANLGSPNYDQLALEAIASDSYSYQPLRTFFNVPAIVEPSFYGDGEEEGDQNERIVKGGTDEARAIDERLCAAFEHESEPMSKIVAANLTSNDFTSLPWSK